MAENATIDAAAPASEQKSSGGANRKPKIIVLGTPFSGGAFVSYVLVNGKVVPENSSITLNQNDELVLAGGGLVGFSKWSFFQKGKTGRGLKVLAQDEKAITFQLTGLGGYFSQDQTLLFTFTNKEKTAIWGIPVAFFFGKKEDTEQETAGGANAAAAGESKKNAAQAQGGSGPAALILDAAGAAITGVVSPFIPFVDKSAKRTALSDALKSGNTSTIKKAVDDLKVLKDTEGLRAAAKIAGTEHISLINDAISETSRAQISSSEVAKNLNDIAETSVNIDDVLDYDETTEAEIQTESTVSGQVSGGGGRVEAEVSGQTEGSVEVSQNQSAEVSGEASLESQVSTQAGVSAGVSQNQTVEANIQATSQTASSSAGDSANVQESGQATTSAGASGESLSGAQAGRAAAAAQVSGPGQTPSKSQPQAASSRPASTQSPSGSTTGAAQDGTSSQASSSAAAGGGGANLQGGGVSSTGSQATSGKAGGVGQVSSSAGGEAAADVSSQVPTQAPLNVDGVTALEQPIANKRPATPTSPPLQASVEESKEKAEPSTPPPGVSDILGRLNKNDQALARKIPQSPSSVPKEGSGLQQSGEGISELTKKEPQEDSSLKQDNLGAPLNLSDRDSAEGGEGEQGEPGKPESSSSQRPEGESSDLQDQPGPGALLPTPPEQQPEQKQETDSNQDDDEESKTEDEDKDKEEQKEIDDAEEDDQEKPLTDSELLAAGQIANTAIDAYLQSMATLVWASSLPTFGLSIVAGAIIGDLLWLIKDRVVKKVLTGNPLLAAFKGLNIQDLKIEFSFKIKMQIVAMNAALVALVVAVVLFFGLVMYAGCTFPLGQTISSLTKYKTSILGLAGYGDLCESFISSIGSTSFSNSLNGVTGSVSYTPPAGSCQAVVAGDASPGQLSTTCFGAVNANTASIVAGHESGGNPLSGSTVDICLDSNGNRVMVNGQPARVSWGLFQINLTAHKIGNLNCPAAFDRLYTAQNHICSVVNPDLYTQCVNAAKDSQINIATACQLSNNGTNWGPWQADINACHIQ